MAGCANAPPAAAHAAPCWTTWETPTASPPASLYSAPPKPNNMIAPRWSLLLLLAAALQIHAQDPVPLLRLGLLQAEESPRFFRGAAGWPRGRMPPPPPLALSAGGASGASTSGPSPPLSQMTMGSGRASSSA